MLRKFSFHHSYQSEYFYCRIFHLVVATGHNISSWTPDKKISLTGYSSLARYKDILAGLNGQHTFENISDLLEKLRFLLAFEPA